MRTQTRAKIVQFVARRPDGAKAADIIKMSGISFQAVHRHLRALVKEGTLTAQGKPPATRYFAKAFPRHEESVRLDSVRAWHAAKTPPKDTGGILCSMPEDLFRRFELTADIVARLLPKAELSALLDVMARLAGNAFDHNDGHWHEAPGCWLETQLVGKRLWICVADRGQGVLRSLRRAHPDIPDEQAALAAAFERTISGSGRKGEGLKKVRATVMTGERGIACRSGRGLSEGIVHYGKLGSECRAELARLPASPYGTIALVAWSTAR